MTRRSWRQPGFRILIAAVLGGAGIAALAWWWAGTLDGVARHVVRIPAAIAGGLAVIVAIALIALGASKPPPPPGPSE